MLKIALSGKANSGKNTVAKLLTKELRQQDDSWYYPEKLIAFSTPIKKIAHQLFPDLPSHWLYGASKYRNEIIPNAFKNGQPLTVRQLLIDIGNDFGRKYQPDIWIRHFDITLNTIDDSKDDAAVIVTDCRFREEFDHLKKLGFFQIRIVRKNHIKIDDISETDQDGILDSEFSAVIDNNGTKEQLKEQIQTIIAILLEI
jgi:hypothetical protein